MITLLKQIQHSSEIKRYMLDEKHHRNASKFATILENERKKLNSKNKTNFEVFP